MTLPQLRIRSEYNFRSTYGPIATIADRLAAIECPTAGLVDSGTWGHVQWWRALRARDIHPAFGTELTCEGKRYWILATDTAAFYRISSRPPETMAELADARGVLRFANGQLTDPDTFDYIDLNPGSVRATRRSLDLAERTGKPLVLTSDPDYPGPDDRDRFLAWADSLKMTPQHVLDRDEMRQAFWWLDDYTYWSAHANTTDLGNYLAGKDLHTMPMIEMPGDLEEQIGWGIAYRVESGHIAEWTAEYQTRLTHELELIRAKNYESYFLLVEEIVTWAKERMLVGPARGSSAGSLICYVLRITEVDPLVHGLIFERFIDANRSDLPDIDIDFNDQRRDQVFRHMNEHYGRDNVARIGNVSRLKPRSAIAHVGKKLGIPHGAAFGVANVLVEHAPGDERYGKSLEDTFHTTQPGQEFMQRYPEAALMGELENHASHSSVHAAGVIVSNRPVIEYVTVRDGIAHADKEDAEALNLLKIDALGLRTLGVIEDAIGDESVEILYALTLDDPEVLRIFREGKFSGVFQFEGQACRRIAAQVPITNFRQIDHITALARPGPMGSGAAQSYIDRANGREEVTYLHPSMEAYLADTYGVVLYQEQVMRIVREIGRFSWKDTIDVRKAMGKSKGREAMARYTAQFIAGASTLGIEAETAADIYDDLCAFGAYGMNRAHTVSYAMISYWCAYMKRYHALEFAAACLRSAKDDDQVLEILRELRSEGVSHVPFDADRSEHNWAARDDHVLGGFLNLKGIGPVRAAHYIHKRDEGGGLDEADRAKLAQHEPKFADLAPAHTLWGDIYEAPGDYGIEGPVREFAALDDDESAVVIARLIRSERRDENEAARIARRGFEKHGDTQFLDLVVVDDSTSQPVKARIRPRHWQKLAQPILAHAVDGEDWFLIRGRWLGGFSMMIVSKVRGLTNPEIV